MKTGLFYAENGNPYHYSFSEHNSTLNFPGLHQRHSRCRKEHGAHKIIGNINLEKIDYYCKYLAIYAEEEISKITNITVEQIN